MKIRSRYASGVSCGSYGKYGKYGSRQRGQALTEFLVLAVALLPLLLLMPVLAKYQDISSATQMASRYAAFDAMSRNDATGSSWKPEAELAAEISRRFFSSPNTPIRTGEGAGNGKSQQNLFWRDPQDNALIRDLNADVTLSFGPGGASATHAGGFTSASDGKVFEPLHPMLDLRARGIYTANVSVKLADLPAGLRFYEPLDKINLQLARGTSVAIDSWAARDPQEVESRIGGNPGIFPAGQLAAVAAGLVAPVAVIDAPAGLTAPRLGQLEFWRDVVPGDRVK